MTISLILPPDDAPLAFKTLGHSFVPMMRRYVGMDIQELSCGAVSNADTVLHCWPAGDVRSNQRHIEIFVDGDWPPTEGIERVYPSHAWRNYLWGKYGQIGDVESRVIPNWIDPELWPIAALPGQNYVLYVGRLWRRKMGITTKLIESMPNQEFVLAGEGVDSLRTKAPPNARYVGQLRQGELAAMMGLAHTVICPSQYCEPFGLAAVEAEMTGTRVIASNVGAFVETLSPYSSLLDLYDLEAWQHAIQLGDHFVLRQARREYQIAHHSPAVIAPMYERLLKS